MKPNSFIRTLTRTFLLYFAYYVEYSLAFQGTADSSERLSTMILGWR